MSFDHPLSSLPVLTATLLSPYGLMAFDVESPPSVRIREAFSRAGLQLNVRTEINASLLALRAVRGDTIAFVDPLSAPPGPALVMLPFRPRTSLSLSILPPRPHQPSV